MPTFSAHTWQECLRMLESILYSSAGADQDLKTTRLGSVSKYMQERYPGPYRVVIKQHDHDRNLDVLDLEFDDPEEETMWLLKWS